MFIKGSAQWRALVFCLAAAFAIVFCLAAAFAIRTATSSDPGPPKITQAPGHKKVEEEGTVRFICKASGDPAPNFHWEKGNNKINNQNHNMYEINNAPYMSVLQIKQVKVNQDNTTFTCVANNGLGEARADASLTIYPKVERSDVSYQPQNLVAKLIYPNEILVKWEPPQEADSIERYELYFNDSHYMQNGRISIDPPFPIYKLIDLTMDTIYHIQVSAKYAHGEGPRTPAVQVRTPVFIPLYPEKVRVEAVNSTAIFVEWKVRPGFETYDLIKGYRVLYIEANSNNEPIGRMEQSFDTQDSTKTVALITGLKPETKYLLQVAAYTRTEKGLRSRQKIFTTKGTD